MNESTTSPVNQKNFEETPYEDARWEVVGERPSQEEFLPLDVKIISRAEQIVDPMFDDYGGLLDKDTVYFTQKDSIPDGDGSEADEEEKEPMFSQTELEEKVASAVAAAEGQLRDKLLAEFETEKKQSEEKFHNILQDLSVQIEENKNSLTQKATDVALELAKKLIEEAVEINPEYILPVIQDALGLVGTANIIQIRVSPQDLEFLDVMNLRKSFDENKGGWEFVSDETVKVGCVVDTSAGEIDFQLDHAWQRVRDKVVTVKR